MESVHLFELASQRTRWLSARQIAVAENIANANTPGYKAADVVPFEAVYNGTRLSMAATSTAHIGVDPMAPEDVSVKDGPAWEVTHSGNSVGLEQELLKAGEVTTAYSLNRGVVKAFHQMLIASLKG
ncbi:flagellar basal body rod protein FlgB [Beijerinckiaceae bacterium]|nr:flagellar basal body rod protein FlgB [Beijerinckiaceae bacterium]